MILLSIQARVRVHSRSGNPPPFLGGVLHGLVEHLLHQHAPSAFEGAVQATPKRYAVFAPPPGPVGARLGFGIGLYGDAGMNWREVAAAMQRGRELHACGWRASLGEVTVAARPAPGISNASLARSAPVLESMAIDFVTPLKLITSTKREEGRLHEPPTFVSLARSVARRISALEPDWAERLGLHAPQWAEHEAQAQHVALVDNDARPLASWYGSADKLRPVPLSGLVGRLRWRGPIAWPLVDLLAAGQWVGAGQSTSLGMGMYRLIP